MHVNIAHCTTSSPSCSRFDAFGVKRTTQEDRDGMLKSAAYGMSRNKRHRVVELRPMTVA